MAQVEQSRDTQPAPRTLRGDIFRSLRLGAVLGVAVGTAVVGGIGVFDYVSAPKQRALHSSPSKPKVIQTETTQTKTVYTTVVASSESPQQAHPKAHAPKPTKKAVAAPLITIPRSLPAPVVADVPSAVKVYYNNYEGSGERVGSDLVLTAGHMVVQHLKGSNTIDCKEAYTTNRYDTPRQYDQITNWLAYYSGNNHPLATDAALLRIRHDRNFDKLPIVPVATQQPKIGTKVFFINYEGSASGPGDRYPNKSLAAAYHFKDQYGHPAEYVGVVLGHEGQALEVALSLQGFGPHQGFEKNSHGGASGGEVLNSQGRLIGEDVRGWGTATDAQLHHDYDFRLLPHNAVLQLELVQPITESMLEGYEKSLGHKTYC